MSIIFNSCLSEVKAKLLEVNMDPHRYALESKKKLLLEAKECRSLFNENSLHLQYLIVLGVLALIFIGYTIYKKYQRNINEYIGNNNINFLGNITTMLGNITNMLERIKSKFSIVNTNIQNDVHEEIPISLSRKGSKATISPLRRSPRKK